MLVSSAGHKRGAAHKQAKTNTRSAINHSNLFRLMACCLLHTLARLEVPTLRGPLALGRAVPARACGVSRAHVEALQQVCKQQRKLYLASLQPLHFCRPMSLSDTPRRSVHLRASQLFDDS